MRLEDQVTSLELSKKLKELGVKQESVFCWATLNNVTLGPMDLKMKMAIKEHMPRRFAESEFYSAFTVAELGELLPHLSKCWRPRETKWICEYVLPMRPYNMTHFTRLSLDAETEANARAKLLIYLIEQGIVKP